VDRAAQLQQELASAYGGYHFHQIYQKLHTLCANDLGWFYLDDIKDRLYTTRADSVARRSAQTALYHIAEALVRWIAPILSFTAEEIWENLPGERGPSVMLAQWYEGLQSLSPGASMGREYWQQLMSVRAAVNKEMESQRAAGVLRGSLDASVSLYCSDALKKSLSALGDELRYVLITSEATLFPQEGAAAESASTELPDLRVLVVPASADKCERCWHRRSEVGESPTHPTLCGRCIGNIDGDGEQREYA
jgi:isoleucyl-tRNA synthetase